MSLNVFSPLEAGILSDGSPWGVPVTVMKETTSSNDEMLQMGESGSPNGSLLFAEHQTAGRGQFRRPWSTTPGLGLSFSLLLRLEINDATIPSLSAFAAVAIVELLKQLEILGCVIKAPNDVLIRGRKVAGVLVETRGGKSPFAVVGIGINVNHTMEDFPLELRDRAGSLAMSSGTILDRTHVASVLLKSLWHHEQLMRNNPSLLTPKFEQLMIPMSTMHAS